MDIFSLKIMLKSLFFHHLLNDCFINIHLFNYDFKSKWKTKMQIFFSVLQFIR